jgi:hypothetical protein
MPLYYFNIFNDEITMDAEGIELDGDEAAMARAVVEARIMAAESVRSGHLVGSHHIEVLDEAQRCVGAVRFDEAVAIS